MPGVSGNPGGRPKGASVLAPMLRKLAANPNEHGEGKLAVELADQIITGALVGGDITSALKVMERTDPEASKGSIKLTGDGSLTWGRDEPEQT